MAQTPVQCTCPDLGALLGVTGCLAALVAVSWPICQVQLRFCIMVWEKPVCNSTRGWWRAVGDNKGVEKSLLSAIEIFPTDLQGPFFAMLSCVSQSKNRLAVLVFRNY